MGADGTRTRPLAQRKFLLKRARPMIRTPLASSATPSAASRIRSPRRKGVSMRARDEGERNGQSDFVFVWICAGVDVCVCVRARFCVTLFFDRFSCVFYIFNVFCVRQESIFLFCLEWSLRLLPFSAHCIFRAQMLRTLANLNRFILFAFYSHSN